MQKLNAIFDFVQKYLIVINVVCNNLTILKKNSSSYLLFFYNDNIIIHVRVCVYIFYSM